MRDSHRYFFWLWLIGAILTPRVKADIFDTFVSYRHGSNDFNIDTARFPYETEIKRAPASIDEVHVYTQSHDEDGSIDVVHCYSMRNGLYGGPVEARLIWSKLDF